MGRGAQSALGICGTEPGTLLLHRTDTLAHFRVYIKYSCGSDEVSALCVPLRSHLTSSTQDHSDIYDESDEQFSDEDMWEAGDENGQLALEQVLQVNFRAQLQALVVGDLTIFQR
jgi:hypothetical protein